MNLILCSCRQDLVLIAASGHRSTLDMGTDRQAEVVPIIAQHQPQGDQLGQQALQRRARVFALPQSLRFDGPGRFIAGHTSIHALWFTGSCAPRGASPLRMRLDGRQGMDLITEFIDRALGSPQANPGDCRGGALQRAFADL